MKIKVLSDSSCDILSDESIGFTAVPLTIQAGDKTYVDNENLDVDAMIADFAAYNGKSSTACPSVGMWLEAMEDADVVYIITMTSGISGTFGSAQNAKRMYLEQHPDRHVEVFDTMTTAAEQRVIVEKALEIAHSGAEFSVACDMIRDYILHTRLFFSLESLKNFSQNGRVSKILATIAGILGIKIYGTASPGGELQSIAKCKGYAGVLKHLFEDLEEAGYNGGKVRIGHVQNPEQAERVKSAVLKKYPAADVLVYPVRGLCSYYAEKGGLLLGFECENKYNKNL